MKSPSITIVTPTYNRCQALARAIDSVRAQTVSDYEHVIVDDGSTDNTGEMVAGYGDKRIRYFSLPHRCGANTARNLAIQKARAPVLGFLDSDDEYQPFRLQHTLDILEANPQTPLMLSSYAVQRKSGAGSAVNIGGVVGGENFERALAWRLVHIAGTSITARRDAARRIGGFNPVLRRMQDRDFLLRMAQTGSVALSDRMDWIKHNSPDAVTLGVDIGGVEAFGDLVEQNDCYRSRYPSLIPFFVARRILKEIKKLRMGAAGRAFNENLNSPSLGFSASHLIRACLGGSRKAAAAKSEFNLMAPNTLPHAGVRSPADHNQVPTRKPF